MLGLKSGISGISGKSGQMGSGVVLVETDTGEGLDNQRVGVSSDGVEAGACDDRATMGFGSMVWLRTNVWKKQQEHPLVLAGILLPQCLHT